MPVITIQVLEGPTREQKAEIVRDFTNTMVRVLGKNPESTHIVFQEISTESWGQGGLLVDERRKAAAKAEPK